MRKIVFAALAAAVLFCPFGAGAQVQFTYAGSINNSGTLTTGTTDSVQIGISGTQWATVRFKASVAGTATATAQAMVNGQWIASAYATRLSTVSANPTTQPISATTLVAGDIWEVPLPANSTAFQLLCAATGSATSVQIYGGIPYSPGMVVTATLFDVTSAINTDNPTGTLDLSGWSWVFAAWNAGGATTIALTGLHVFDDGNFSPTHTFGAAAVSGDVALSKSVGASGGFYPSRRMSFDVAAVAAQQTRLRVEVSR